MAIFNLLSSFCGYALLFLCVFILVAFLRFCFLLIHSHWKYDHIPGPPRDSFFLGHTPSIVRATNKGNMHDQFLEWAQTYGPVYRVNMVHGVMMVVTCPEATKEILMSAKYPKDGFSYQRVFSLFGQRFMGNGLLTTQNHAEWYKQRRMMDPAFSSLYLRGLTGSFNETAEKFMNKLEEAADSKTEVNMLTLFNNVTLDVITKVAFGVDLDLLRKHESPLPKSIEICLRGMVVSVRDIFFQYNPMNWGFVSEVKQACQFLRTTGEKWVNDRKVAVNSGEDVPKDILTQIIKTAGKEETTKEDEELMLDNFLTFFIAGQETTANQLGFCVMELGRHPDIVEKAKKEVDDVIGMKREISYEDLSQLTYLGQVLKETLRLYPPAPVTSREIKEDIVINGITIPAGGMCFFSTYVASRLEHHFKDPETFDPERFHPDAPKPYYCYYPFSLGPRVCLGQNFAQLEAKLVMAKLLQRFDFTLVPGQSFDLLDMGTLKLRNGVVCAISYRKE